jgi:hypothetical protein
MYAFLVSSKKSEHRNMSARFMTSVVLSSDPGPHCKESGKEWNDKNLMKEAVLLLRPEAGTVAVKHNVFELHACM